MPASALPALPPLLTPDQSALLTRLTDVLEPASLWWVSGYTAGLAQARSAPLSIEGRAEQVSHTPARPAPAPSATVTVVYGSQTGNSRRVAEQLAQEAEAAGLAVRLLRADAYPTRELAAERLLYLVISTQGDGDPPDDARGLVEFIAGRRAPQLAQLRYAVLGLGDSSYAKFCEVGRQLDERLAALGAQRLLPRADADLDIDSVAGPWHIAALDAARSAAAPEAPLATVTPLRPAVPTPGTTRAQPFAAEVLSNQPLIARASHLGVPGRDIRHVELSLQDSGIRYEPGDSLGVWPRNPPALVDAVIEQLGLDGMAAVTHAEQTLPLHEWLSGHRELTRLSRPFAAAHAARAEAPALDAALAPAPASVGDPIGFAALAAQFQVIDLLQTHPAEWSASDLVAALRPLAPRLYSIASSQKHVGDEAHLTVAHVAYSRDGQLRWGAASHSLARAAEGERLRVFVERNDRFRLPADPARDVIMIGPGTGVAPFRGFVQERAATRPVTAGATGRNWLLFGNRNFRSDFLYQLEWQQALRDGRLQRLDLAFSRDRRPALVGPATAAALPRDYVQHRLLEHGREVYAWLEGGAHLYVCGDATRMARDVHAALVELVATHSARSRDDAEAYIADLQKQGRYARDVY
ncbi:MAG: assimilatory sulfite reductase (NADPH) flavoprotein subunit [Pseudomonadota bacterium]|nr:assimilatory sulfite reductase (NADPH) flavoprotein subunit [Pseudomonadota bacterium]